MSTPREKARIHTMFEIRRLAWEHLETEGAAALSLRAIARDLGMVSSAIYRYVPSRDDLLTMLITQGYRDLADAVELDLEALPHVPTALLGRAQWLTISQSMRAWALHRPAAWSLLYGSPVPGYAAPAEATTPEGTRVVLRLGRVMMEAAQRGEVKAVVGPLAAGQELPHGLGKSLNELAHELADEQGQAIEPAAVAQVVIGWTSLLGAISSEVFGQLGRVPFGYPDAFARVQFAALADAVGLRDTTP